MPWLLALSWTLSADRWLCCTVTGVGWVACYMRPWYITFCVETPAVTLRETLCFSRSSFRTCRKKIPRWKSGMLTIFTTCWVKEKKTCEKNCSLISWVKIFEESGLSNQCLFLQRLKNISASATSIWSIMRYGSGLFSSDKSYYETNVRSRREINITSHIGLKSDI